VFVRAVWDRMFETAPAMLLHPFEEERARLLTYPGHKLFWFPLNPQPYTLNPLPYTLNPKP